MAISKIESAGLGAGTVLQVVNATYSTSTVVTSATYTDSGLTASITPKFSTSKILVIVSQPLGGDQSGSMRGLGFGFKLLRDSTSLWTNDNCLVLYTDPAISGTQHYAPCSLTYVDSPATTSSTTYKTQIANKSSSTTNSEVIANGGNTTASIILMEIAA